MKKTALLVLISILLTPLVSAGGFETAGFGTRQMSMGGAVIGLADDWTAIYWNPAGLGFLEGSEFGFDIRISSSTQYGDESLRNMIIGSPGYNPGIGDFPIPPPISGNWFLQEPARFNEDTITNSAYRPSLGWYKAFDSFTFAIGMYGSGGSGADWSDAVTLGSGDVIAAQYETATFVLNLPVGVGVKLNEKNSFGAVLQILYGSNTQDIWKTSTDNGSTYGDYTYISKSDASGYGLEIDLGYLCRVTETFQIGATYRSQYVLKSPGEVTSGFSVFGPTITEDFELSMKYPQRIGVGTAWKVSDTVLLTGDIYYINFSAMSMDLDYDTLTDRTVMDDLKNTYQIRLGCELTRSEALALWFGYFSDASPYPDTYSSVITARYTHADVLSAGIGYTKGNISYNGFFNYTLTTAKPGNGNLIDGTSMNIGFGMKIGL